MHMRCTRKDCAHAPAPVPGGTQAFRTATEYDPPLRMISLNDGIALAKLGADEEAIAAFDQELAINPKNPEAATRKGVALLRLGRHSDAINSPCRIRGEQIRGTSGHGIYLGLAYSAADHLEDAIRAFDKVLEINRRCSRALFERGKALARSENPSKPLSPTTGPLNFPRMMPKSCTIKVLPLPSGRNMMMQSWHLKKPLRLNRKMRKACIIWVLPWPAGSGIPNRSVHSNGPSSSNPANALAHHYRGIAFMQTEQLGRGSQSL